jgi:hypothetical protein
MRRAASAVVALSLLSAACSQEPEPRNDAPRSAAQLTAEVASFDLSARMPTRFLVGLGVFEEGENLFVVGGSVELAFSYLGETQAAGSEPYRDATASFLPIPGSTAPDGGEPVATPDPASRGVYAAYDFEFDRAGLWEVEVTADVIEHGAMRATSAFEVLPEPQVPAPGDRAPAVENLMIGAKDAPEAAIDSRATTGGIPDPELHRTTVAEAIRTGRPALVVVSTPVYCVSRFCGPVTDVVQELAADYGDRADFIHIEVWRDFEGQVVNKGAADWILRGETLQEPWVFLVGADGRVVERWDNVATRQEMEPLLRDLPVLDR